MLLSLLIFLPIAVSMLFLFLPSEQKKLFKTATLLTTFAQLVLALYAVFQLQTGKTAPVGINRIDQFQLVERYDWINLPLGSLGQLSIEYFVGVDGLNSSMMLLTAIVMFIGAISSWEISHKEKGYFSLYLLLSGTIMGCFVALDFFLFFLFFEFMLLPMYFLIGLWGGERREYAAVKFFIYTFLGSIFILIVMIGLYTSVFDPVKTALNLDSSAPMAVEAMQQQVRSGAVTGKDVVHTFNIVLMTDQDNYLPDSVFAAVSKTTVLGHPARLLAFLFLFIGFAVKLPAVPVHTWLPDAHVEAPTPISVVLAGILLKIGGYGLIRTAYCIFPDGAIHFAPWIGGFGVLSILYAAYVALGQSNLKKMIAYSSVSHMGFVLLGLASLTSEGVNGAIYQLFSHGILSSMLFLIAGVIYSRTHDLRIENYRGLMIKTPVYSGFVTLAFFGSLGLPGMSGFMAELLVFLGAFKSHVSNDMIPAWMPIAATLGLLLGAAYYLWTLQRMFLGRFSVKMPEWEPLVTDINARERSMLAPLGLCALVFGLLPHLLLNMMSASVSHLTDWVAKTGAANLEMILGGLK